MVGGEWFWMPKKNLKEAEIMFTKQTKNQMKTSRLSKSLSLTRIMKLLFRVGSGPIGKREAGSTSRAIRKTGSLERWEGSVTALRTQASGKVRLGGEEAAGGSKQIDRQGADATGGRLGGGR